MSQYKVKPVNHLINCAVSVPGSKSMTNRALLMAALSNGICTLKGVLFSDDSRHFLASLISLGFVVEVNEVDKMVVIHGQCGKVPKSEAEINVGSAGTAARFLTAFLAMSNGDYVIRASKQMENRPMGSLFHALSKLGAEFTFLGMKDHLPVRVRGAQFDEKKPDTQVAIDISESTQFLSALMMTAPVLDEGLDIHVTSHKVKGAYIHITQKMMLQFGCNVQRINHVYRIEKGQGYQCKTYQIEPDVSAACYFFAAAAMTGGHVLVKNVHSTSMQGDMKFINVLKQMGCAVTEEREGICVTGPKDGKYAGVDVDMNDFSDQALTLAAMAPFATTPTYIRNIGHIRKQESDRIHAIVTELTRMGIRVEEEETAVRIYPGKVKPCMIETYEDHRVAMAFALVGLRVDGIVIDNYKCCAKTFENYFEVLETLK
jgi:3-phosphoshikimate 1-carboxyvinyltransferase